MAQRAALPPAGPGQPAVEVVGGSFAWTRGDASLLREIHLAGERRCPAGIAAAVLRRAARVQA